VKLFTAARRFSANESGGSMVEFALVTAFILVPLLFGIIEFGRLTWSKDMIVAAAREGARYAIVHGSYCELAGCTVADSAAVANTVIARTQLSPLAVRTQWAQDKDVGDTVTVTVTYVYTPIVKVPFLTAAKTITGRSRQVVVY
jgi:Flp pilus assembly protein TadG